MSRPNPPHQPHPPLEPIPLPAPENGIATAGMATAACGAVLAMIPIAGFVSWALCPVGIVLCVIGLSRSRSLEGSGRGKALAGLALGAAGLLVCVLWLVMITAAA